MEALDKRLKIESENIQYSIYLSVVKQYKAQMMNACRLLHKDI